MQNDPTTDPLDQWRRYAPHRAAIAACVRSLVGPEDRSIALLGAGFALDVDLRGLVAEFSTVTLVDIDATAIAEGAAWQLPQGAAALCLQGGIDIAGLREAPLPAPDPAARIARLRAPRPPLLPVPQDGIVSLSLLSQLIDQAVEGIAPDTPGFAALVEEVRLSHWRTLVGALRPGGWALLVTDVVASDSLPALCDRPSGRRLAELLEGAKWARNHFYGLNPDWLCPRPGQDPWLDREMTEPALSAPWVWEDGPGHARLMVAVRARRARG